ncbi:MAG: hypothetical protein MUE52_04085 [Tabrizicola sp.]|jgi:outer membrane usher protein FimD/PapC|nr:hypothetical protein [Tabrizicola sp.]
MRKQVRIAECAMGLGLMAVVAVPLAAQDEGGLRLTFGISSRLENVRNPGLTVPAEPDQTRASSRLSFGLTDTTRRSAISFSVAGTVAKDNDDDTPDGLVDPNLNLSLKRIAATSAVELSAFLRENDLDSLRTLILDPDTGDIVGDVTGDGTQRQKGGTVSFAFGEAGPWGGNLSGSVTETTYTGTTSESDSRRSNLGASLRFRVDPATEVSTGLRWSRYAEAGEAARKTVRSDFSFRRDQRAGYVLATVFAEATEDGTRSGLSFERSWELPDSSLSLSLGVTRGVTGDLTPTGQLDWQKELSRGTVSVGLRHDVSAGDDDQETVVTAARFGLSHELTRLSSIEFGLNASGADATDTSEATWNAALSATYSHSLPNEWTLDAGMIHRIRSEDGSGKATSNTVFLELRRNMEWRP